MSNLEKAIIIAAKAHQGQEDKAGYPYILHPIRMMLCMSSEIEMIIAVLHDVVEDTDWTLSDLQKEGFSAEVLEAVDCLTRRDGESYEKFISRVRANPIARRVKIADLEDNMNIKRISNLTEKDMERLKKYHRVWLALAETEKAQVVNV